MRKRYEMTRGDLEKLLEACEPQPYMVFGGMGPESQQERANRAWCELGNRMGFDGMSVESTRDGDRFFTADVLVEFSQDGNQRCAVRPGFVNLQESNAGFGDTDAAALADLERVEEAAKHAGEGI